MQPAKNLPLLSLNPNPWNPNRMSARERAALVHGLRNDGWIASQALLVWATDETGERRDLIIDGEHRWRAARELGFLVGPVVELHDLTEVQAKALTIKLNAKRGAFDPALLRAMLDGMEVPIDGDEFFLELGIPEIPVDVPAPAREPGFPAVSLDPAKTTVNLVSVLFQKPEHTEFIALAKRAAAKLQTTDLSQTVLAALRKAIQ
jgi:hypothetical protein